MKTSITAGLTKEEKEEIKGEFVHSFHLRKRLVELLEKDIERFHADMRDEDIFLSPNWSLIQVDRIAQEKAIRKIISLLSD